MIFYHIHAKLSAMWLIYLPFQFLKTNIFSFVKFTNLNFMLLDILESNKLKVSMKICLKNYKFLGILQTFFITCLCVTIAES